MSHTIIVSDTYLRTLETDLLASRRAFKNRDAEHSALAIKLLETEHQLKLANVELKARNEQIAELPALILDTVTEQYGDPCDEGLAAFMSEAGLEMPTRTKTVTLEWSETINYYAEEEMELEWCPNEGEYVVSDRDEQSLRDSAHDSADYGDNYNYSLTVKDA